MTNESDLSRNYMRLRRSNAQGNIIRMHHAFRKVALTRADRMSTVILPVFFIGMTWLMLPLMITLWGQIFEYWMTSLYKGQVGYVDYVFMEQPLSIPYPVLTAEFPNRIYMLINMFVPALLLFGSFAMPKRIIPLMYMLRIALLIQISASVDYFITDFFPYDIKNYTVNGLMQSIYLIILIPIVLSAIYFIFDFSIFRKVLLTSIMLFYFAFAVPCQYMLHAYIIHECGLEFLPILYILFGILLDILAFMGLYSFALSWKSPERDTQAMI